MSRKKKEDCLLPQTFFRLNSLKKVLIIWCGISKSSLNSLPHVLNRFLFFFSLICSVVLIYPAAAWWFWRRHWTGSVPSRKFQSTRGERGCLKRHGGEGWRASRACGCWAKWFRRLREEEERCQWLDLTRGRARSYEETVLPCGDPSLLSADHGHLVLYVHICVSVQTHTHTLLLNTVHFI